MKRTAAWISALIGAIAGGQTHTAKATQQAVIVHFTYGPPI